MNIFRSPANTSRGTLGVKTQRLSTPNLDCKTGSIGLKNLAPNRETTALAPAQNYASIAGGLFILLFVPALALTWFSPGACAALASFVPLQRPAAEAAAPTLAEQVTSVLADWMNTAAVATPDAAPEATRVAQQLSQQNAATQALHDQQTNQVNQAILTIQLAALKTNIATFMTSVADNTRSTAKPPFSPYQLAHARSAGLHQEIVLLRQAIAQLTNPAASILLQQQLNLRYQEVTALDHAYKTLTGRRALPTAIYNNLVSLDTAIATANANGLTAEQQEFSTGRLLPVNSSPFTFTAGNVP